MYLYYRITVRNKIAQRRTILRTSRVVVRVAFFKAVDLLASGSRRLLIRTLPIPPFLMYDSCEISLIPDL